MKVRKDMKQACEDSTGCAERIMGGGRFYVNEDGGVAVSDTKAQYLFRHGFEIEAPNAGAGSYKAVLERLGFKSADVIDWTSSAGDWCFKVRGGYVTQRNRYPYHGFGYSLIKR